MQTKFKRENYFGEGWDTCVAQFLELFHRYGYIYKPLAGGSWASANEKWKLNDSEILKAIACAHPKFYIGCRPGKASRFAVLDIDAKSKYHNKAYLNKLLKVLSEAGLTRSSLYRSSYSGGWHIYLFFDEPISSSDLRRQLVKLLLLHDFDIAKGILEIFPHPSEGSLGMGLRLPLQPGWAWLDKETLEVEYERDNISATAALELFIDALDGDANSYDDFRKLKSYIEELEARKQMARAHAKPKSNVIPFIRKTQKNARQIDDQTKGEFTEYVISVFQELPPGILVDTWYNGRNFHINGLTGPSQRAEAIFCLGHYLFYGDPSRDLPALGYGYEQERNWAVREILLEKHNGQSKDINRNRADALTQIERATHWRPANKRNDEQAKAYRIQRPIAWVRENANRKIGARKRIAAALEKLKELKRAFTTVELQTEAGCSRKTLYVHSDIWRQMYEDLAAGFFETCTHEYNVVEAAAPQESKPPSTLQKENTPPGLLAARQIIYEISMRSKREQREKQKAVIRSNKSSESEWRDRVIGLTQESHLKEPTEKIKTLLVVLSHYLSVAPNYDDALNLQGYIYQLKDELLNRAQGPQPSPS